MGPACDGTATFGSPAAGGPSGRPSRDEHLSVTLQAAPPSPAAAPRRPWRRRGLLAAAAVGVAVALLAAGAVLSGPSGGTVSSAPAAPAPAAGAGGRTDAVSRSIAALQTRLRRVPADASGWAQLGLAYVQQARLTADPSYYPKAEGALRTSLERQPTGNAQALTGQATLAAARHEFGRALALADASLRINAYSATTYGVRADALTELGRYDDAVAAVQRMLDLQPGTPSFARASYQRELRGDVPGARQALEQARDATTDPADQAFSSFYLGELAWNTGGGVAAARRQYDEALASDPAYLPALVGQARATAAAGDRTAALALYREAVQTQPQPQYLIELGELLEAAGQRQAAREQYEVVRVTERLFAAAGSNVDLELALFEADHGSAATALRYATSAYRARPQSILTQDAYAWALHRAGRDAEALPLARRAQRLGTRLPVLAYHLGVIEAAAGDRAAARASLRRALALNPDFNPLQAPKARTLLATLS